jgi:hypothetical protein
VYPGVGTIRVQLHQRINSKCIVKHRYIEASKGNPTKTENYLGSLKSKRADFWRGAMSASTELHGQN